MMGAAQFYLAPFHTGKWKIDGHALVLDIFMNFIRNELNNH